MGKIEAQMEDSQGKFRKGRGVHDDNLLQNTDKV